MSSGKRKRKTTTNTLSLVLPPTPESNPIPSLPADLMLSCLARVPRSYYPYLSLVSKSLRSLLASPELYETRSLLRRTESCLYVCLQFPTDPNPRLFTLCRKPDRTQTNHTGKRKGKNKKKKSSCNLLVPIASSSSPPILRWSCLVAAGSNIYNIGGHVEDDYRTVPSTSVSVLDCWSHTWREGPSFPVEKTFPTACVVDGKIYVDGECKGYDSDSCCSIEVLDPKTQTWDHVPSHKLGSRCSCRRVRFRACIEGKFHMILEENSVAYNPKESRWDLVQGDIGWHRELSTLGSGSYCVTENVLYCYPQFHGWFKWYDTKARRWRDLEGLVGLPKIDRYARVRLADYGGRMVVLWEKDSRSIDGHKKMIWCAEISLERREDDEIWGNVEWFDGVLPVPGSFEFVQVLAATL